MKNWSNNRKGFADMKIAIASSGSRIGSNVDFHTGRAACFIIYDTEQEDFKTIENWQCIERLHLSGLEPANFLIDAGVKTVIIRNIGPNAFRRFKAAHIYLFHTEEMPVYRSIRLFREGKLSAILEPNCVGHIHGESFPHQFELISESVE